MMFAVISLPDLSLVETIQPVDVGRVFLAYGLGSVIGAYAVQRAVRANQYAAAGVLVSGVIATELFATGLLERERSGIDGAWVIGADSAGGLGTGRVTGGGDVGVGGVVGGVTHVQGVGDVGRRDGDAEGRGPGAGIGAGRKTALLFPAGVDAPLGLGRVEGLVHESARAVVRGVS